MCSRPGGDRGPGLTFSHHVDALKYDKLNRFNIEELWNLSDASQISSYDIFWFYAKGFHPELYNKLKDSYPA